MIGKNFALIGSSDCHKVARAGTAQRDDEKNKNQPSGISAVYAVHHNTRDEIWDAYDNCDVYALHVLKIRAFVEMEDQMCIGRWINVTDGKLDVQITANATFYGMDSSGKTMCPHGYTNNSANLDKTITNIWLCKKNTTAGYPFFKVLNHSTPNQNYCVVNYTDINVQDNDAYYVMIEQNGESHGYPSETKYRAIIGGFFIWNVSGNSGNEEVLDINQSLYDRGFRIMPGWDGAQEIRPTYNALSRVDLYMTTWGDPWGPIVFQICEDTPNGNILFNTTISKDNCPDFPIFDWVTVDISDIPVTPGERYVIVLRDGDDGDTHNCLMWGWCDSFGGVGPYSDGEFLFRKLGYPTWLPIHDWDYTFRTFGYDT